ncbi:MAG: hypothetical protein ACLQJR_05715 [Stellaceae bacterium]
MRSSTRAALERRIEAAEAEVGKRFVNRAMDVLTDALDGQTELVRAAVFQRLRGLARHAEADPAWHADGVLAILRAVNEIAPTLAGEVADKLGIPGDLQ